MKAQSEAVRPRRPDAGFSLIEALFAALLLVLAAGGLIRAISAASMAGLAASHSGLATRIARARLDRLHAAPFSRGWPLSGYHEAVAPGGSVDPEGPGIPGYVEFFGEDGERTTRGAALYEVRWRIFELMPSGGGRLAGLGFEVVAMPISGGRGPVVRLNSLRVANRE